MTVDTPEEGVEGDRPFSWPRLVEFALLFGGIPFALTQIPPRGVLIPILLVCAAVTLAMLLLDRSFDRAQLWNAHMRTGRTRWMLAQFALLALGIGILVAALAPERLFGLVKRDPGLWAVIMVAYPVFSVYPQEVIYRTFLFHRYRGVFRSEGAMIAASAIAFGFMHIIFRNWLAVAMTLIGGALFAMTYARTRSTLMASIEHALFGCFVFTIGLGRSFYGGAVGES